MDRNGSPVMGGGDSFVFRLDPSTPVGVLLATFAKLVTDEVQARQGATKPTEASPLIDGRECGKKLGVSSATLYRLCRDGVIPFITIGDTKRFDLAEVRKALEKRSAEARPAAPVKSNTGIRCVSRGR